MSSLLGRLQATDCAGTPLAVDDAFAAWGDMTADLRAHNGEAYFVGNGASAAMASHCAADIMKNGRVRARVFTDNAMITALGNDLSYERVFSEPLFWCMRPGDMLVAVSSSGASPNIISAVQAARRCRGLVVTLSAFKAANPLRGLGDLNFYVPAPTYGLAESCHAAILHYWVDRITAGAPAEAP